MRLAPEGYPFVVVALVLAGGGWAWTAAAGGWVPPAVATGLSVLSLFVLWFFRDPRRQAPGGEHAVVAPGEGRVIDISEVEEPTFLKDTARKISIFLSIFDVHVQRAPVSGTVEHKGYTPGKYEVAWRAKASDDNEQAVLGITTPHGRVLVKQIAGLVARRIVTDPRPGEAVVRGERIGLIRFGSRVELFVPTDWEITCSVGDRARVGATELARRPVAIEA